MMNIYGDHTVDLSTGGWYLISFHSGDSNMKVILWLNWKPAYTYIFCHPLYYINTNKQETQQFICFLYKHTYAFNNTTSIAVSIYHEIQIQAHINKRKYLNVCTYFPPWMHIVFNWSIFFYTSLFRCLSHSSSR